ncbi:transposase [Plakobranchus ocellatus]|uniref:Transposase n=1 Tax=Plakobranchus ocellatus TaxID=259542 RepID=A0AAV4AMK7_9GAST|nr:transposase [Plakobranchus ocellatus]
MSSLSSSETTVSGHANLSTGHADDVIGQTHRSGQIMSYELSQIFQIIFYCIVGGSINLMGTVTNVLNIMVFCRQGFRESINVSLCGLAVSDLGCLLTLQWLNICFNPLFQQADLSFDPLQVR